MQLRNLRRGLSRSFPPTVFAALFCTGLFFAGLAVGGCGTTAPAGENGLEEPEETTAAGEQPSGDMDNPPYTEADLRFMQGMIIHHAQAVRMSELVPQRSDYEALDILSQRIGISQRDEIALMQNWLRRRGEEVPEPDYSYPLDSEVPMMAGMLTGDEMQALAEASGRRFDRLFLEGMIQHHRGALVMVDTLLGSQGAAQDPLIFEFANEVAGVQRSQISRMRTLLYEMDADTDR